MKELLCYNVIYDNKQKRRRIMSLVYCIRTREKGKHLKFDEREDLEAIVNQNNAAPKKDKISQKKWLNAWELVQQH